MKFLTVLHDNDNRGIFLNTRPWNAIAQQRMDGTTQVRSTRF